MRLSACIEAGLKEVPVIVADELTEAQQQEFIIKDNVSFGEWDWAAVGEGWGVNVVGEWGLERTEFDLSIESGGGSGDGSRAANAKLSDRFIIPPFSVLDTKQGAWQDRKRYWLSLGIKSEVGRDAKVNRALKPYDGNPDRFEDKLTSIFDPVLCELAYKWFNIPNGSIIDPFAGGSVRGIVAAKLGYEYYGNDLSENQIEANNENAKDVLGDGTKPKWTVGDSTNIDKIMGGAMFDMVFSCPPYADLEVYSDAPNDISNMPYAQFILAYNEIIKKSCALLKQDRFAVFVVGDVRDKKGFYQNFVSDTIRAFWNCGAILYNEMVLVTMIGNLPMTIGKSFSSGRKVGKQHQNVLVFYKGNPKNIKANYPELDLSYMELEENAQNGESE